MPPSRPVYQYNAAIVRAPSASVVRGLRGTNHGDPDYRELRAEHDAYVAALQTAGLEVTVLPALEEYPDSVFVEDPALVFTEAAVVLRSGALPRQGEARAILPELRKMFEVVLELPPHCHADGGDVLVTPGKVLIGLSQRTDLAGAEALIRCLRSLGYDSQIVHTPKGVLHFKTECSLPDEETVLVTPRMAQSDIFNNFRRIVVNEGEEPAANALRINGTLLVSAACRRTIDLLDRDGYAVLPVKTTEIEKIDAGLSCMSLRWFRG